MGFIITNVKKSKNFLMTNRATNSLISFYFDHLQTNRLRHMNFLASAC
jgi:hypothetical protein